MPTHARVVGLVPLAITLVAGFGAPIDARTPDTDPPAGPVVRVPANDGLTPHHLARLTAASPTARELLARLERVPAASFIVRGHPRLVESERLLGRGRFWVVHGHLYGLLEYQAEPEGSHRALEVLAHELAHALEIGLLPRMPDARTLETRLRARAFETVIDAPSGIETDFARAVSHRVQRELHRRNKGASGLVTEASRSHVPLQDLSLALVRPR
jgi:hypothetical protein